MMKAKPVFARSRNISLFLASVVLSAVTSLSAHAMDFDKPSDAVELRQNQMSLIAAYFGDMGAMVKNRKPFDAAQFKTDAERLAMLASWAGTGFEKATYMDSDSRSNKAIWQNKADFDRIMSQFAKAANDLKISTAGGNLKASIPAFKAVASTCGSCHKRYRE